MKHKITIKQIAKELGVSVSTVSKALRDSYEISQATKDKVIAYAKAHNYQPNNLAIQLRNKKTKVIGIVLPKIVHHFFSKVISGIEKVALERGYNIMVCFSNEKYTREVETINALYQRNVDGFIVSIAKESLRDHNLEHFYHLIDEEIPLVLFDRIDNSIECDKVVSDDIEAGYKATKHLIDTGCKKIGIITTPKHITVGWNRYQGYKQALEQKNITLNKKLVLIIDDENDISSQIEHLLSQEIDAVFAVNEIYAAVATRVAKQKGMNIPENFSVIGFTDGLISEHTALTTIDQHGFEMGEKSASLLIDRIEQKNTAKPQTIIIPSNIKIRESTKT